jgi:tetratricopeptide (TPR) repeat protein
MCRYLLIILFIPFILSGQNKAIDSLKLALKNAKHDSTKVRLLDELSENCEVPDILKYAEPCVKLSEENANKSTSKVEKRFYLGHLARSLSNLAFFAKQGGKNEEALKYYSRSLSISEQLEDKSRISDCLNNIGYIYSSMGDIPNAIDFHQKSLKVVEQIGDKRGISLSLNHLGTIYKDQGDIPKALDYYLKALKLSEELKNKFEIGQIMGNMANVYENQGDHALALEFYDKVIKLHEELNQKGAIALDLNNIGFIYIHQGYYEKAKVNFHKSLALYESIQDKAGMGYSLNNLGNIYSKLGNKDKAKEYFLECIKIREEIKEKFGLSTALSNLSQLFISEGNYNEAYKCAVKSMQIAKEIGFPLSQMKSASALKLIFQKQNKYKEAFEMYELEIKMRDSINNQETQKAAVKKQMQYTYEKKAAEIKAEQEKKDILVKDEQEKQKIIKYSISTGLVLVLFLALFILRGYRQKQKANTLITQQKLEVENQKHYIEEKHKEITDSINYAERIQRSFIATKEILDSNLKDYFVLFKPKDVVSGDFYWASKLSNGNFALATADSTGHGVPGAIMSLLNITSLEKAIETNSKPEDILNSTRKTIIERLKKDGSEQGGKDGMDASLTVYDFANNKLIVAAANNPVWIVRYENGSVTPSVVEVKPDKMPVGKHDKDSISFTQQEIDLQTGDVVYTLTDGFPDQFGGEKGKKFMSKNLRELLAANAHLPMHEQKQLLEKTFSDWVGNLEQVDDVTIIGVRV